MEVNYQAQIKVEGVQDHPSQEPPAGRGAGRGWVDRQMIVKYINPIPSCEDSPLNRVSEEGGKL